MSEQKFIDLSKIESDVTDDLVVIARMENLDVVQMNIDWLNQHMDSSPVATGLMLGELLILFEEVKAKLLG